MDAQLKAFADNADMFATVKKVVLDALDLSHVPYGATVSDEILGQNFRAHKRAVELVENAFSTLARHKSTPGHVTTTNPAR